MGRNYSKKLGPNKKKNLKDANRKKSIIKAKFSKRLLGRSAKKSSSGKS